MPFTSRQMISASSKMPIIDVAIEVVVMLQWMVYHMTCMQICNPACMLFPLLSKVRTYCARRRRSGATPAPKHRYGWNFFKFYVGLLLKHFKEEGLKLRLKDASSVFKRWSTWATMFQPARFQSRPRTSKPLKIGHCLRRERKFATLCSSSTYTPSSSIILAILRLLSRTYCGSPNHKRLR
jgi:hypothetical protein